jgi:hypothetical protein
MAEYSGKLFDEKVGTAPPAEDDEFAASKARMRQSYEDKKKADQTSTIFGQDIPSFFTSPAGLIIEGTAAAVAAQKAFSAMGGLKDRMMNKGGAAQPTASSAVATEMPTPEAPVQQELPKPTFPQGQVQQPAVSGYGQQTLNAPTGVPNVAAPAAPVAPPAEVAPAPVDPIQAARIRKAEAEAAMAEHKLQQLQAGATQKSSGKAPPAAASESEMQMIQKGGAASVSQRQAAELKALDANLPKSPEPIQASATPVEKQAAVAAVESKPAPAPKKIKAAIPSGMTKEEFGMMNHLLGTYGGKEEPLAQKAYEQVKDILGYTPAYPPGQGGSLTSEETGKVLGWRKENIPGPKVNLSHEMKGVLKKGGPAAIAAIVLTPEFAKASTAEKRQIIGESLLPVGMTAGEANAPGVEMTPDVYKLGSPYYSSQEAKNYRQAQRVGAGRGIAPPSSYQR